jgi:hypothetical protein
LAAVVAALRVFAAALVFAAAFVFDAAFVFGAVVAFAVRGVLFDVRAGAVFALPAFTLAFAVDDVMTLLFVV